VDLNAEYLQTAGRGEYGKNSFREDLGDLPNRYFTRQGGKLVMAEEIRTTVKFMAGNILEPAPAWSNQRYRLIFCRNLLIYFTAEARERAVQLLKTLLADDGILISGHAEAGIFRRAGFEALKFPKSFAFQKARPAPAKASAPGSEPLRRTGTCPAAKSPARQETPAFAEKGDQPPDAKRKELAVMLAEAEELADRGDFRRAEKLCSTYLREVKDDFRAYYLGGLIKAAGNDVPAAEQGFNKALYLRPDHYESLISLALLKKKEGKNGEAELLKKRAAAAGSNAGRSGR
jgi:chemotaxis protein methyltransferase WspC